MTGTRPPAAEYLRFLAWAAVVAGLIAALGWVLARRWAGEDAGPAWLVGCVLSLLASAVGGIPVARARRSADPAARVPAMMAAMALRFAILLVLGAAAGWSGEFARGPLLLGAAASYLALLVVDTRYAVRGF